MAGSDDQRIPGAVNVLIRILFLLIFLVAAFFAELRLAGSDWSAIAKAAVYSLAVFPLVGIVFFRRAVEWPTAWGYGLAIATCCILLAVTAVLASEQLLPDVPPMWWIYGIFLGSGILVINWRVFEAPATSGLQAWSRPYFLILALIFGAFFLFTYGFAGNDRALPFMQFADEPSFHLIAEDIGLTTPGILLNDWGRPGNLLAYLVPNMDWHWLFHDWEPMQARRVMALAMAGMASVLAAGIAHRLRLAYAPYVILFFWLQPWVFHYAYQSLTVIPLTLVMTAGVMLWLGHVWGPGWYKPDPYDEKDDQNRIIQRSPKWVLASLCFGLLPVIRYETLPILIWWIIYLLREPIMIFFNNVALHSRGSAPQSIQPQGLIRTLFSGVQGITNGVLWLFGIRLNASRDDLNGYEKRTQWTAIAVSLMPLFIWVLLYLAANNTLPVVDIFNIDPDSEFPPKETNLILQILVTGMTWPLMALLASGAVFMCGALYIIRRAKRIPQHIIEKRLEGLTPTDKNAATQLKQEIYKTGQKHCHRWVFYQSTDIISGNAKPRTEQQLNSLLKAYADPEAVELAAQEPVDKAWRQGIEAAMEETQAAGDAQPEPERNDYSRRLRNGTLDYSAETQTLLEKMEKQGQQLRVALKVLLSITAFIALVPIGFYVWNLHVEQDILAPWRIALGLLGVCGVLALVVTLARWQDMNTATDNASDNQPPSYHDILSTPDHEFTGVRRWWIPYTIYVLTHIVIIISGTFSSGGYTVFFMPAAVMIAVFAAYALQIFAQGIAVLQRKPAWRLLTVAPAAIPAAYLLTVMALQLYLATLPWDAPTTNGAVITVQDFELPATYLRVQSAAHLEDKSIQETPVRTYNRLIFNPDQRHFEVESNPQPGHDSFISVQYLLNRLDTPDLNRVQMISVDSQLRFYHAYNRFTNSGPANDITFCPQEIYEVEPAFRFNRNEMPQGTVVVLSSARYTFLPGLNYHTLARDTDNWRQLYITPHRTLTWDANLHPLNLGAAADSILELELLIEAALADDATSPDDAELYRHFTTIEAAFMQLPREFREVETGTQSSDDYNLADAYLAIKLLQHVFDPPTGQMPIPVDELEQEKKQALHDALETLDEELIEQVNPRSALNERQVAQALATLQNILDNDGEAAITPTPTTTASAIPATPTPAPTRRGPWPPPAQAAIPQPPRDPQVAPDAVMTLAYEFSRLQIERFPDDTTVDDFSSPYEVELPLLYAALMEWRNAFKETYTGNANTPWENGTLRKDVDFLELERALLEIEHQFGRVFPIQDGRMVVFQKRTGTTSTYYTDRLCGYQEPARRLQTRRDGVIVRTEPDVAAEIETILDYPGTRMLAMGKSEAPLWYYVILPDGRTGWVKDNDANIGIEANNSEFDLPVIDQDSLHDAPPLPGEDDSHAVRQTLPDTPASIANRMGR